MYTKMFLSVFRNFVLWIRLFLLGNTMVIHTILRKMLAELQKHESHLGFALVPSCGIVFCKI